MAWFGLDKIFLGVDLDAEQQRSNAADSQLQVLNQGLVDKGVWTQEQADQAAQAIARGNASTGANDVVGSVDQAFGEGLAQGEKNITSGISDTIARLIGDVWKAIPWQLWLVLAAVLFFYLGGLGVIRRKFLK
jgi:hypothetical protein